MLSIEEYANLRCQQLACVRQVSQRQNGQPKVLAGTTANLLMGYDVYQADADVRFWVKDTKPSTRRYKYGTEIICVKHTTIDLPSGSWISYHGYRVLTPAALIIDHLRGSNPYMAIANAEAVVRGVLKPDVRLRENYDQQFAYLLQEVEKVMECSKLRAKRRVLRRLKVLSPWSESVGESVLKVGLLRVGISIPQQQFVVGTAGSFLRLDFCWPDQKVAIDFTSKAQWGALVTRAGEGKVHEQFPTWLKLSWQDAHNFAQLRCLRRLFSALSLEEPSVEL